MQSNGENADLGNSQGDWLTRALSLFDVLIMDHSILSVNHNIIYFVLFFDLHKTVRQQKARELSRAFSGNRPYFWAVATWVPRAA
jgi:hypothetical protein